MRRANFRLRRLQLNRALRTQNAMPNGVLADKQTALVLDEVILLNREIEQFDGAHCTLLPDKASNRREVTLICSGAGDHVALRQVVRFHDLNATDLEDTTLRERAVRVRVVVPVDNTGRTLHQLVILLRLQRDVAVVRGNVLFIELLRGLEDTGFEV